MNEYAMVRMSKFVRGTNDLPESDPLRLRYFVRADNLDAAYNETATRWPNEEVRCVSVRENVNPFVFAESKRGEHHESTRIVGDSPTSINSDNAFTCA